MLILVELLLFIEIRSFEIVKYLNFKKKVETNQYLIVIGKNKGCIEAHNLRRRLSISDDREDCYAKIRQLSSVNFREYREDLTGFKGLSFHTS